MEKFLEKIQLEIENKMLACMNGKSIVKPFAHIYNEVRERLQNEHQNTENDYSENVIYSKGEQSIYAEVVRKFLEEHPELKTDKEKE